MSGFPLDSAAIFKNDERQSLIMPDRQTETAAAWMAAHPEITHVSRDRGAEYASAASTGAPQAVQVADRFHVCKNLSEAVQRLLARVLSEMKTAREAAEGQVKAQEGVTIFFRGKHTLRTPAPEQVPSGLR